MNKTIKEIAENKKLEYQKKYVEWCKENPGKIMNGNVIKTTGCDEAKFCDTIEELDVLIKVHRGLNKEFSEKKQMNGHKFIADAIEEIKKEYLNV